MTSCLGSIVSWAQITAVFVAICGLVGIAIQIHRSRFSLSVELTLKLEDKFNSQSFRKVRAAAAKSIKSGKYHEAEDLFDFFETIGLLVRRKALNKEMVWHTFFHWVHGYWLMSSAYISDMRKANPSTYRDFALLNQQLYDLEKRENISGDSELTWSPNELKQFMLDESKAATA